MTAILYLPWVGVNYEKAKLYGKRIMILGESHYGKIQKYTNDTTSQVIIEAEFERQYSTRFLRMVPPALLGLNSTNDLSHDQRKDFWNSVMFYNYIQETVNSGPRGKRTIQQWLKSIDGFIEIINQYKPEIIMTFGIGVGNNLPRINAINKDINGLKAVEYTLNDGSKSIAVVVRHPAGGMSYSEVHNVINRLTK